MAPGNARTSTGPRAGSWLLGYGVLVAAVLAVVGLAVAGGLLGRFN